MEGAPPTSNLSWLLRLSVVDHSFGVQGALMSVLWCALVCFDECVLVCFDECALVCFDECALVCCDECVLVCFDECALVCFDECVLVCFDDCALVCFVDCALVCRVVREGNMTTKYWWLINSWGSTWGIPPNQNKFGVGNENAPSLTWLFPALFCR